MSNDNRRETGARTATEGKAPQRPFPDTGDAGDRPKKPYGLTRPTGETNEKTRQSDGKQPVPDAAERE